MRAFSLSVMMILSLLGGSAFAELTLSKPFAWKASGEYTFAASDGPIQTEFHGNLRPGPDSGTRPPRVDAGIFHADLKAYDQSLISLVLTEDDNEIGEVFLLRADNGDFSQLNPAPILGRRVRVVKDLDLIVEHLRGLGYDDQGALAKVAWYFKKYPDKKLDAFVLELENGTVEAPKPAGQVAADETATDPLDQQDPAAPTQAEVEAAAAAAKAAKAEKARARRLAQQQQQQRQPRPPYGQPDYVYGQDYGYNNGPYPRRSQGYPQYPGYPQPGGGDYGQGYW